MATVSKAKKALAFTELALVGEMQINHKYRINLISIDYEKF